MPSDTATTTKPAPTNAELAEQLRKLEAAKTAPPAAASSSGPPAGSGIGKAVRSGTSGKRLVVVGVVGTGALTLIAAYRNPNPKRQPFRIVIGVFVAGVLLAVLAEFAPGIASGFSMLMLATAAFVVGSDAWAGISAITAPTS